MGVIRLIAKSYREKIPNGEQELRLDPERSILDGECNNRNFTLKSV